MPADLTPSPDARVGYALWGRLESMCSNLPESPQDAIRPQDTFTHLIREFLNMLGNDGDPLGAGWDLLADR
jgi:hypothetical protein